jgi:predicted ATPase/DNA-binding winged helix-turn-helix (wHTH) protein
MEPISEPLGSVTFGRFQVLPHRRELLADRQPIKLGGRGFDVLMALIEAHGAVVSKDALMARVWPDRIVEENALQAQISALRTAFGSERELIRTVAGRGYQFTGEIRTVSARPDAQITARMPEPTRTPSLPPTNLPERVSELIGRDAELGDIVGLTASHRLITLAGAGGIGKTRLGIEVAQHLLPQFADGVWIVELAPLSDPELVPATVAAALGLELASGTASPLSVADAVRSKQLMLVLDNCEHVIDAAARMAETLLRVNPAVHVIATGREALRTEGEWVYVVPPLAVPPEVNPDSEDLLRYGAVRLFVERARAAAPYFSPDARVAAAMAGVCRRLDGIPLAIELAAARVAALGIEGIATLLDDRFRLLAGGRRTALPRHQTLRATLDWSYELLTEPERVVLRRLAIFAGGFTLPTASAVAAGDGIAEAEVIDCVANLVAKSLVTTDFAGVKLRYRLLETTRAYALEKLVQAGEFDAVARRHGRHHLDLFEAAEAEAGTRPTDEWLADDGPRIDNVRAALDWAFSPAGDASIGVALTAATVPLWMHLSLMDECRGRVDRALAAIAAGAGRDERREMQLHAALAQSLIYSGGAASEIEAIGTKALEIAESRDDIEYQLRSLWGQWSFRIAGGQHRVALTLAQRFYALAAKRSDPNDRLIGKRMIGGAQYYLGDLLSARGHLERVLAHDVAPARKWQFVRFQVDPWASARAYLARILWLQGLPDQAMRTAESSVADARATNHAMSLGNALAVAACPIALWAGDLTAAEHYVDMLLDHSTRHVLGRWGAFGRCYQGMLVIQRGDANTGLRLLRAVFAEPAAAESAARLFAFLISAASGHAGQIADGLPAIEEAIIRSEHTEERWLIAELLRVKGELLLSRDAPRVVPAVAEGPFRQALDWARRQGALSWELRAATSLARLWRDQGLSDDAITVLQPVYDRFTEGFGTVDLREAKALLDALQS